MPADAPTAPFVGRDAELAWLRALWDEATAPGASGPRLAVLVAETGLGKSRIVQEFYRRLAADPVWNDGGYWPDAFTTTAAAAQVNPDLSTHRPPGAPRFLWLGTRWLDADARNAEARRVAVPDLRERLAAHVRTAIHHAPLWQRTRSAYARALKDQGLAGGVEQIAQEGAGKLFEAVTGGLPFGGLLVTVAKAAPAVFAGPSRPADHDAAVRTDAIEGLLDELGEVFGGFGGGGLVLPTVLWLDDAQWMDEDTAEWLRRAWTRGVERGWPLLIVVTHWEREWRLLATGDDASRARSLRRYDGEPGARVRYLDVAADADLDALLRARLPGLTVLQRQLMLSRAGGNFLTLVENIGELLAQPANFAGRDVRGPLARAGERRVADWESDRERRVRQRFAALDERLRDLLGWSSHGGQRFLHAVLARFLAGREGRTPGEAADARAALEPCVDPLAILAGPSPAFFEFRDVALHRAAREHFDLYLAEHDEPALAQALRETLADWVNACFDAAGEFVPWRPPWTQDERDDTPTVEQPLLFTLDEAARREVLARAARELSLDGDGWFDPARRAALRARAWLLDLHSRDGLWRDVAAVATTLEALDAAPLPPGVLSVRLLIDAGVSARLAGISPVAVRLHEAALALANAGDAYGAAARAAALAARGVTMADDDRVGGARMLEEALAIYEGLGDESIEDVIRVKTRLSLLYEYLDDADRSVQVAREVLDVQRRRLSPDDSRLSWPVGRLGWLHMRMGEYAEADALMTEALAIQRRWAQYDGMVPAGRQVDIVPALLELAELRARQKRPDEAEALFREALEVERRRGADNAGLAYPLLMLAVFLEHGGRKDEAVSLVTEAVAISRRVRGDGHPRTRSLEEVLAGMTAATPGSGEHAAAPKGQ